MPGMLMLRGTLSAIGTVFGGLGVFFSNALVGSIMGLGFVVLFLPMVQAAWTRMRGTAAA